MDRFDALAKLIWNKPLSEVSEEESAKIVRQYPFFSAGQFLHLQNLSKGTPHYDQQYQKAILYHHDPVHFNLFLTPPHVSFPDEKIEGGPNAHAEPEINKLAEAADLTINEDGVQNKIDTTFETVPDPVPNLVTEEAVPNELLFEPFHTVDYFASQGIKPVVEDMPNDKFGKQLKSFTDWLKTMKKLPVNEGPGNVNADKNVESLAAHSVADASIITESMAEVWLKQGNREKAAQTYNKLSLQNPAKSAYFAAKIKSITEQK